MRLFVGLGNPGPGYSGNRHNVGFMAIDAIAARWKFSSWRARFHGETCEGEIGGVKVLLLKPKTYMNESGRAVADAARFFKIDLSDIIVFHDELDLAPAKIRIKAGGGNAGHNGLRSISPAIGNDYTRVRIGIGHPGDKNIVHSYVLSDFAQTERDWVSCMIDAMATNADLLAKGDEAGFQNKVHTALEAKGLAAPKRPGEREED
jgi:peptidyl-tRNA hydrolase, PTH1 family